MSAAALSRTAAQRWAGLDSALRKAGLRAADATPLSTALCITIHVDGPSVEVGRKQYPFGRYGAGRYAIRRGVERHLQVLADAGMHATFFVCGYDVEHHPALYREILAEGHEIAAHGYLHEAWDLGEEEPALLEKTHRLIQDQVGVTPVGWCSPSGRKSARTLPTLVKLGYVYDASEKDADHPYLTEVEGRPFAILPNNTVSLDDYPMYFTGHALPSEVLANWKQELQALRTTGDYVHLAVHPKAGGGSGTPARTQVLVDFLAYASTFPDVAVLTLEHLARHCLAEPSAWRAPHG